MAGTLAKTIALLAGALSLSPSYAHVLEALPRLSDWPPDLWRETTVFQGQFQLFATIGGPVDVATIPVLGVLASRMRGESPAFRFALAAVSLYALALICWFMIVAPANAVLSTWRPGPIPVDFHNVRSRWEFGHMAVAAIKLLGFVSLSIAIAQSARRVERHS